MGSRFRHREILWSYKPQYVYGQSSPQGERQKNTKTNPFLPSIMPLCGVLSETICLTMKEGKIVEIKYGTQTREFEV